MNHVIYASFMNHASSVIGKALARHQCRSGFGLTKVRQVRLEEKLSSWDLSMARSLLLKAHRVNSLPVMWMIYFLLTVVPIAYYLLVGQHAQRGKKTPPRRRSFPFIGESIEFLNNPNAFVQERSKRLGHVFCCDLFGSTNIITTTSDAAQFFLNSKKCVPSKLKTFENLVGLDQVNQAEGALHSRYRGIILSAMHPEVLKHQVKHMDCLVIDILTGWKNKDIIYSRQEGIAFTYNVITSFISEQLRPFNQETVSIMNDVVLLGKGLLQFPVSIPFSPYYRALQARKRVHKFMDEIITIRRGAEVQPKDLLGSFLQDVDMNGTKLSNKEIEENLLACLFAGHHTTANTLVWMMKYLYENPKALQEVKEEQRKIARSKESETYNLTWDDTRNMPATLRAIHETLRLSNIVSMILRTVAEDVEYDGHMFPKGWQLKVFLSTIHLNDEIYPESLKFDPSRFEVPPKSGTYLPFGSGSHMCPGMELAKLELLIFMHRLVVQYSWEPVNPHSKTRYCGIPVPEDGYQIRVKPNEL